VLVLLTAILLVIVAAWASRRPLRTAVPVYAFLVPIGGVVSLSVPLPSPFNTLSSLAGALAIGAAGLRVLRGPRRRIPTLPVGLWLLFTAWCALTFLWANDPSLVASELTIAIPLLMLVVLVAMIPATRGDLEFLRDAVVASGIAVGAWAAVLTLKGGAYQVHALSSRFSLSNAHSDPNQLAATLLLPLALSIDLTLTGQKPGAPWWRVALGPVGAVMSAFAIVLSGSRGGSLAAVVTVIATLVLFSRRRPWQRYRVRQALRGTASAIIALVVLGAIFVALFPSSRLATVFTAAPVQRLFDTQSSSGRAEIWTTGALACERYCVGGVGMGNFPIAYEQAVAFSNVTRNVGTVRPAHDLYLEIGVETGVLGLVLFWLAIFAEWRTIRLRGSFPVAAGLAATLIGFLLADVFEGFLWFKHAWLPFLLIRVLESAADGEAESEGEIEAVAEIQEQVEPEVAAT
jgi:O-antigen ligase